MTVLIAGVGYIGVPLALAYLARGESVVGLENFFCTPAEALAPLRGKPGFQLVRGSISSLSSLDRTFAHGPFETIHLLAAQPSASPAAAPTGYTERTNLVGSRMLLDAVAASGSGRVIFGSSFQVYGAPLTGTVREDRPYGAFSDFTHLSKVYVEKLLEMYSITRSIPAVSVRLGIVYGLGPVMKTSPMFMTVPNRFASQAARGEPLQVNPGAVWPLGFIHLEDAVGALLAASRATAAYLNANATTEVLTVSEVALAVREAGRERGIEVQMSPPPPLSSEPDNRFSVRSHLDDLGWQPAARLSERVGEVVDYFLSLTSSDV